MAAVVRPDFHERVIAAREGCDVAFSELVRATYDDTYTLALRLTGNPEDADDVAQDTYLRAFRGLRRFRGDAAFTTWLYRITTNCAHSLRGRRDHHDHEELTPEVIEREGAKRVGGVDPESLAERAELRDRLRVALVQLPPKLRDVVILRDVNDLAHDAIASRLGITEGAAKVRLHRARRRLHELVYGDASQGADAGESLLAGAGQLGEAGQPGEAGQLGEEPGILERIGRGETIDNYETVCQHKDGSRRTQGGTMPARLALTKAQRDSLLVLPDTEEAFVRHYSFRWPVGGRGNVSTTQSRPVRDRPTPHPA